MGLRLLLASLWVPRSTLARELERIRVRTNSALDALISQAGMPRPGDSLATPPPTASLEDRRAAMAEEHNQKVRVLVEALGEEEAMRVGREAMFRAGMQMGKEARIRLKVGDGMRDLVRAARVLYRVLGIEFDVERSDGKMTLRVSRCALADRYTESACRVLSAADEGVVRGLNPRVSMRFVERMTSGSRFCVARIEVLSEAGQ